MEKTLHLLQVASTAADAAAIVRLLEKAGYVLQADYIPTANKLPEALSRQPGQLVIIHHPTAVTDQVGTIEILHQYAQDLIFIVIVDKIGRTAIDFVKAGACDCIARDELPTISSAVEKALQQTTALSAHAQTLKALRESEEKFSRAFHISPDSININRLADGVFIDTNEGFTRILGYTRDDVCGRASTPDDLGIWVNQCDRDRMVAELKVKDEMTGLEAPFRAKDGRIIIGLMSARILKINGVECVLTVTRDITERKQAEKILKESEERYRGLFEHMAEGFAYCQMIFENDRPHDFIYLSVNPAFEKLTGLKNVVGRKVSEIIPGLQVTDPDLFEIYGRAARTQSHKRFETYVKALSEWFSVSVFGTGNDCFVAVFDVITARKQVEEALRESEERLRRAVAGSPFPMMIHAEDGEVLMISKAWAEIAGYPHAEIPTIAAWTEKAYGERGKQIHKYINQLYNLETRHEEREFLIRTKSGAERIWHFMSAPLGKLSDGRRTLVSMAMDVTERKQTETERDTTIRLLRLCNQHNDTREFVHSLTLFFQELTGCEAIGVRLHDGPDFPYYETRGFAQDFVLAETKLCARDKTGELIRDSAGNPILDCMCGNILCGRCDPNKPFFTKHGSFWTNSTTELLADTTEDDRQARTRNRCNGEGYESVALIPLRNQTTTIGLIQLNDRRKGRFTAEKIAFFEGLAEYTTIALKKLESDRALRESEEHLRTVLDTSEAGYFFIDTAGCFQRVNSAWLRLHGYDRAEEVIGKHFSLTQVEADQKAAHEIVEKLLAGGHVTEGEFTRKRKDGSIGYHTFTAHLVKEGQAVIGFEGFIIDTTGLRAAREQYAMLFEQMLDGFALHEMIFDAAGNPIDYRFIALNPAFEEMTGLKASSVIGRCVRDALPGIDLKWIKIYGEVVRTGQPKRFEDFSRELNKHFEVMAFRPQPGQFACLVRDVTTRKQLELQLLHSQKMEAVGQLAGGVAHDFNNFLAAIMMHLGLLQETSGINAEIKDSLKELESEAKRAANLTRQLLMFSRKQAMQLSSIDLNDLLANLVKMLRRLIGEHIKLVFNHQSSPLWIEADPSMIDQVIMNLCVNARDAMPQGGRMTIETGVMSLSATEVLGDMENRAGKFACITVIDTGCGMDSVTLNRIFEPFFTTKEPGKGTGLGLATVYSIIKQHRGWINVKSSVNQGSTFRIFLPAGTAPTPSNGIPSQSTITGGAEGVLVVEDDFGFRNMVAMSLKVLGYRVFVADNGNAALQLWEKHAHEIGLLFTDLVMPEGMSGLELCQRLKQTRPSLRMIITTGYSSDQIKLTQLATEGITFLPKPFTAESLANAVRQCIDKP